MKYWLGLILVGSSLIIVLFTYLPLIKHETEYRIKQIAPAPTTQEIIPVSREFGLVIPKLSINSSVIKNVDPETPKIYQVALTQGVAHAEGSSLPGEKGNIFIFAHSSVNFLEALKYNSIFYLLPKLDIDDSVILYYREKQYKYLVTEKKIINPDNLNLITDKSSNTLVLMTCYPPGTNLKRYIIIAKPEE